MTENTNNLGVSVRVPQWVLDEIERRLQETPRPRPSRGELLTIAWKRYASGNLGKGNPAAAVEEGDPLARVPPEFRRRFEQVLDIYNSGDAGAIKAVEANIDVFHERPLVQEYLRLRGGRQRRNAKRT